MNFIINFISSNKIVSGSENNFKFQIRGTLFVFISCSFLQSGDARCRHRHRHHHHHHHRRVRDKVCAEREREREREIVSVDG